MSISDFGASYHADAVMGQINQYGLHKYALELEAYGVTVVPPEVIGVEAGFIERLRDAILRACERRNDVKIGDFRTARPTPAESGRNNWFLLEEDEVFVEAALNPVQLALVRWLCGRSAYLAGQSWIIKAAEAGESFLDLHSDAHGVPPGGGRIAHLCNASWLCTDYGSMEDGPTIFVPGSHHYGRATLGHEMDAADNSFPRLPLLGKAGSLAIWHGGTWHGAVPRKSPGVRVTLTQVFMRRYMRPMHLWDRDLSPGFLDTRPELAKLIGRHLYPFREANDHTLIPAMVRPGTDPFA